MEVSATSISISISTDPEPISPILIVVLFVLVLLLLIVVLLLALGLLGSVEYADEDAQTVHAHLLPATLLRGSTLVGQPHLLGIVLRTAPVAQVHGHPGVFGAGLAELLHELRLLIGEVL